jgi:hypothetical protein
LGGTGVGVGAAAIGADVVATALAARINPATTKAGIKDLVFIFLSSSSMAVANSKRPQLRDN